MGEEDRKSRPRDAGAPEKTGAQRIVWRDAGARTARADLAEVSMGREEIGLTFGVGRPEEGSRDGVTVSLLGRVVMTPFMAKRLAIALDETLRRREAADGPIWPGPASGRDGAEKGSPGKAHLLGLVNGLGVELGFERSFKLLPGTMLTDRFLMSVMKETVPVDKLLDACRGLGLPGPFLPPLLQNLPDTRFLHFGFEGNEKGPVYKVYLELNVKSADYPFLIYLGFKWDADDAGRRAVARYTCYPSLKPEDIVERLSSAFAGAADEPVDIAKGIVEAAARLSRNILYVEATEEGNRRRSFDINTYAAGLTLDMLSPSLRRLREHYAVPPVRFDPFIEAMKAKRLGHLSGGIDREGRDFFTVHFGVEEHPSRPRDDGRADP